MKLENKYKDIKKYKSSTPNANVSLHCSVASSYGHVHTLYPLLYLEKIVGGQDIPKQTAKEHLEK